MSVALKMVNISKQFPGVLANDKISFEAEKGEVHALLGENGAGKSTLMSILCGLYKPTSGEIYIDGEKVSFNSAKDAMEIGIGMVHQHFMLIPTFTVVENCLIGYKDNSIVLDKKKAAEDIQRLIDEYRFGINVNDKVGKLSVGEKQRVEILKALFRGAKILILDEPTAVLTPQEIKSLFVMIRTLTGRGYTVLFISHKLNEVKEISDRVSILHLGKLTGTYQTENYSANELASLMLGRNVEMSVPERTTGIGNIVLSVKGLTMTDPFNCNKNKLNNVSFDVHAGEVVGIAGVDGNGQTELIECLTGLQKASGGKADYFPYDMDLLKCRTRDIMKNDVSHIPEDRQATGLVMNMPLCENSVLQDYYKPAFGKGIFVDWSKVYEYGNELIETYGVKTPSEFELASNLSGGNQQKLIVARELTRRPKLLFAMHPTRGVDIGAIEYIHKRLLEYRDQGLAIVLVSTELDEIMELSDKICVLYEGEIMGEVESGKITVEKLGLMMGGNRLSNIKE